MRFRPLTLNVHYDNYILQQHLRNLLSMRNKTITRTRDLLNRIIKNTVDHTRNKKTSDDLDRILKENIMYDPLL